jgi:hypothetical protein
MKFILWVAIITVFLGIMLTVLAQYILGRFARGDWDNGARNDTIIWLGIVIWGIILLLCVYALVIFLRRLFISKIPKVNKPQPGPMGEFVNNIKGKVPDNFDKQFAKHKQKNSYSQAVLTFMHFLATLIGMEMDGMPNIQGIFNNIVHIDKKFKIYKLVIKIIQKFKSTFNTLSALEKQRKVRKIIEKIGQNMSYMFWWALNQRSQAMYNILLFITICTVVIMILPLFPLWDMKINKELNNKKENLINEGNEFGNNSGNISVRANKLENATKELKKIDEKLKKNDEALKNKSMKLFILSTILICVNLFFIGVFIYRVLRIYPLYRSIINIISR